MGNRLLACVLLLSIPATVVSAPDFVQRPAAGGAASFGKIQITDLDGGPEAMGDALDVLCVALDGESWAWCDPSDSVDVACSDISDQTTPGCNLFTALTTSAQRMHLELGTAATTSADAYATSAEGALALTALQANDDASELGSGSSTSGYVLTSDGAGNATWSVPSGGGTGDIDGGSPSGTGTGTIDGGTP